MKEPTTFEDAIRQLAEEHWEWLEAILHKIYVDALIHGYKHGKEAK